MAWLREYAARFRTSRSTATCKQAGSTSLLDEVDKDYEAGSCAAALNRRDLLLWDRYHRLPADVERWLTRITNGSRPTPDILATLQEDRRIEVALVGCVGYDYRALGSEKPAGDCLVPDRYACRVRRDALVMEGTATTPIASSAAALTVGYSLVVVAIRYAGRATANRPVSGATAAAWFP